VTAPDAGTVHLVEFRHAVKAGGPAVAVEILVVHGRYCAIPRACPDCSGGAPETVTPQDGADAAVLWRHDPTCPKLLAVMRWRGGSS
jgi:hypothetical protein